MHQIARCLLLGLVLFGSISYAADRPNIVLILADDFGRELLSAYGGSSYETPNLDRLSREGMTFETCYATPLCSPSRVELMTAQYSFRTYTEWGQIDRDDETFVQRLRDAGYETLVAGKWHIGGWDETPLGVEVAGFNRHCSYDYARVLVESRTFQGNQYWGGSIFRDGDKEKLKSYGPDTFAGFLADHIECSDHSKPFFAYYGMNLLHRPFMPTPDHPDAPKPGEDPPEQWKGVTGETKNFDAMVRYADKMVGRLMDALDTAGVSDNTVLIFTADNGTDNSGEAAEVRSEYRGRIIRGSKYYPTEMGLNVPLIVHWPKVVPAGSTTNALVDFTDLGATCIDIAKAKPLTQTDGQSLVPLMTGQANEHKPFVYSFGNYERSSRRYKDPASNLDGLFDVIRGPRWKWVSRGELYDLDSDWFEDWPNPNGAAADRKRLTETLRQLRSTKPARW